MNSITNFMEWARQWLYDGTMIVNWFLTDFDFGFATLKPLAVVTFVGLLSYLVVAVVKWILI